MAGGKFAGGNGTALSPFLIEDAHDLNAIRNYTNGYYFQLVRDINLDMPPYNVGEGWVPIPYWNSYLDGRGYKIIGLTVKSTGKDVGFVLKTGSVTAVAPFFSNILFEDFYLEINDQNSGALIFTLLGINHPGGAASYNLFLGCSVTGTINYNAPNRTNNHGLFGQHGGTWHAGAYTYTTLHNILLNIKNIGTTRYNIFSTSGGLLTLRNVLIKSSGLLGDYRYGAAPATAINNTYFITDTNTDYSLYTNALATQVDNTFISNPLNLQSFVNESINNKQVWYFTGNSPVEIKSNSKNYFLIEADGKIFSLDTAKNLIEVANAPINIGMFEMYGISHIELIPVEIWRAIRQNYSTIKIHSHVDSPAKKTLQSINTTIVYDKSINSKAVMKTVINFDNFNNDINKIIVSKEV